MTRLILIAFVVQTACKREPAPAPITPRDAAAPAPVPTPVATPPDAPAGPGPMTPDPGLPIIITPAGVGPIKPDTPGTAAALEALFPRLEAHTEATNDAEGNPVTSITLVRPGIGDTLLEVRADEHGKIFAVRAIGTPIRTSEGIKVGDTVAALAAKVAPECHHDVTEVDELYCTAGGLTYEVDGTFGREGAVPWKRLERRVIGAIVWSP